MKMPTLVNILKFLIFLFFSARCLAEQTLTANFTSVPITGELVNGQVLGRIMFINVRQEKDAQSLITGYYYQTGDKIDNSPAGYSLCTSNVPGVGVQYYSGANHTAVPCYAKSYNTVFIFNWTKNTWGTLFPLNYKAMEFVVYDASKLSKGGTFTIDSLSEFWGDSQRNTLGPVTISPNVSFIIPPKKTASIYFPDYPGGNPTINLPFKIGASDSQHLYASAEKTIQMCLADDNGINSSQFELVFSGSYQQTAADTFYLQRQGGSATGSEQVNFHLSISNPLTKINQTVIAAQPINWNNINSGSVNTINYSINGKIQPCVPTPLTIKVPNFDYSSKTSGTYSGHIDILFTPTLNN